MKNPNGFGGITKLSGNRRKPYWVRVTIGWEITETGRQKQIYKTLGYFEKRKEAMLALSEYNADPYDLDNINLTFSEVWDKWTPKHFEKTRGSEAPLKSAYKRCAPLYNMKMKDIKTAHMQAIIDDMKNMSAESQTKVKTIFKNNFKWALENDIVKKDYSKFVTIHSTKKKKTGNVFTRAELDIIFKNLNFLVEFPTSKKTYATLNLTDTVLILLYTGMRIRELLELKCEDINIKERYMCVHGTKNDSADRIVPIHKNLISILKKRMGGEFLIENANGKPIRYDPYKKHFFDPYMSAIGLHQTPHATRHTFISLMDDAGVSSSSVVLKRIVGHADESTTEMYTHKEISQLISAIDKLNL